MAKTTAPLLSFDARGQIAKTQVYSTWKGRPYVRRYTVPNNPQSDAQKLHRGVFAYLQGLTKFAPTSVGDAMKAYADTLQLTPSNGMIKANAKALGTNTGTTMDPVYSNDDLVLSPGANGAPALPTPTVTPGASKLTLAVSGIVLPSGWTGTPIVYGAAVEEWTGADYTAIGTDYTIANGSDDTPSSGAYSIELDDLVHLTNYIWLVWATMVRPDGKLAYTRSLGGVSTPSS